MKLSLLLKYYRFLLFTLMLISIHSCAATPEQNERHKPRQLAQIPYIEGPTDELKRALIPDYSFNMLKLKVDSVNSQEPRFDINVRKMEARKFFSKLINQTQYQVIIGDHLNGEITLNLENVTIVEVMNKVREIFGYDFELDERLFKIYSNKAEERTYQLDVVSTVTNQKKFWKDLEHSLTLMTGFHKKNRVYIDKATGIMVIRAYPSEFVAIENYLNKTQDSIQRRISIDASYIRVDLKHIYHSGIQWHQLVKNQHIDENNSLLPKNTGEYIQNPIAYLIAKEGVKQEMVNKLLSEYGNISYLASSRVVGFSNQIMTIEPDTKRNGMVKDSFLNERSKMDEQMNAITFDITPIIDEDNQLILSIRPTLQSQFKQLDLLKNLPEEKKYNQMVSPFIQEPAKSFKLQDQQLLLIGLVNSSKIDAFGDTTLIINNNSHLKNSEIIVLLQPHNQDNRIRQWGSAIK